MIGLHIRWTRLLLQHPHIQLNKRLSWSGKVNRTISTKKDKNKAAFPPEFRKNIEIWKKALLAEAHEANSRVRSMLQNSEGSWEMIERKGIGIGGLHIVNEYITWNGRTVVLNYRTGVKNRRNPFKSGTPIVLCNSLDMVPIAEGVMLPSNSLEITVNIKRQLKGSSIKMDTDMIYAILPSTNNQINRSLDQFLNNDSDEFAGENLLKYAYRALPMPSIHNDRMSSVVSEDLNESQKYAVAAALNQKRPFVCIQGPPGTGKTHVIAHIITQLTKKKRKILVCAPTHVAVDNILNKTNKMMQLVNADSDQLDKLETIEDAIASHPDYLLLLDMYEELGIKGPNTELKKSAAKLKWKIFGSIYKRRNVIFCTVTSATIMKLTKYDWHPDVVIIDEAAMCTEPSVWPAIIRAKRCILTGDHCQLPPMILSEIGLRAKLSVSLMERMAKEFPNTNHMLTIQYRMNNDIMKWSSDRFYESRLIADQTNATITIKDIIGERFAICESLVMIDTDLASKDDQHKFKELATSEESKYNKGEAELVWKYLNNLIESGVSPSKICVITPYSAQVDYIKSLKVNEFINVNSVDAFQGSEQEVIVFSMVKNNSQGIIGFLSEERRMNVAITRAKRQFVLIGSGRMMKAPVLKSLYKVICTNGRIVSPRDLKS